MAYGDYPAEYNPKVHGPYDPARYYGKRKCTNISSLLVQLQIETFFEILNWDFVIKRAVASCLYWFRSRRQLIENFT